MPATGRKPKPEGQAVNRHRPTHEWNDVIDVPFEDGPKLPSRQPTGPAWPARTKRWWSIISAMPHCRLWTASDWEFALDTAQVAAEMHSGNVRVATELRNRERVLGTTVDYRRDLRIRYVPPTVEQELDEPASVSRLDDFRGQFD
jgi:hypothetical protein